MNIKIRAVILAGIALGAFAGCGEPSKPSEPGKTDGAYEVIYADVTYADVNGRKVPCVIWDGGQAGGISCDWAGAR